MFKLKILNRQPETTYVIDQPVAGFVVSLTDNQLARVIRGTSGSVEVEYPGSYIDRNGAQRAYAVKGDVWFSYRPAMLSDVGLYNEADWIESALISAEAETSA